ncbi:MAG: hypothetical protein WBW13_27825 [Pseudolabrys sp.]
MLRMIVSGMVGRNVSVPDRVAGAALGAIRIAMLAILLVLVFDRIIPTGREPAFLKGSQWRPVLSSAAQYGLQSLPPAAENYIDRLSANAAFDRAACHPPNAIDLDSARRKTEFCRLNGHVSALNAGFHAPRAEAVTFASRAY